MIRILSRSLTVAIAALFATFGATSAAYAACSSGKSLGVSRIVEIDASKGLGLGSVQYKEQGLLKAKEVILTFDDGPLPKNTNKILVALKKHCTRATFFAVGRMAIAFPNTIKRIDREGHTIAVHTWSHPRLGRMSTKNAVVNVERGFSAVQAAAGKPISPFFRFPYLDAPSSVRAHLKKRNIVDWSIDIDSGDTRGYSSSRIVSATMARLKKKGKGILLFHDIKSTTANAIPPLLRRLKAAGYKVVHAVAKSPVKTNAKYDAFYKNVLLTRANKNKTKSTGLTTPPSRAVDRAKPRTKIDADQIFDPADLAVIRKVQRKRLARVRAQKRKASAKRRLKLKQKRRLARRPRSSVQAAVAPRDFDWPTSGN